LSSSKALDSPVDGCAPSSCGGIVGIFATRTFACPGATVIPGTALDDTGTKETHTRNSSTGGGNNQNDKVHYNKQIYKHTTLKKIRDQSSTKKGTCQIKALIQN
jgi:hypothetical protein